MYGVVIFVDILSLINDVADDVAVANTKQEKSYMYTIKRDADIDIEKLRKLIRDTPVPPRPMPSYTFLLSVPSRAWQDEVRAWQDRQTPYEPYDMIQTPLQPLRLEPEPEPHQEMWMRDNPRVVRR